MSRNQKETKKQFLHHAGERRFILKTIFVLTGVLGLQLGLATAYLAAFHAPEAHDIPVAIVGNDDAQTKQLADSLVEKSGGTVTVSTVTTRDQAVRQLKDHTIYGAYVASIPKGEIMTASASDKKLAQATTTILTKFDAAYQQQVRQQAAADPRMAQLAAAPVTPAVETDVAPLVKNDPNGTGLFYVAFSFVFGGYLAAVALNIARGNRAFTHVNALIRSLAFVLFAVVGSLCISLIAVQGMAIIPEHAFWPLFGIGVLTTTSVALLASACISLLGTIGTGLVIILFVILGTPASGGPLPLLLAGDGPWQWLTHYLPTGQAMEAIRQAAYFDGVHVMRHLWVGIVYTLIGFGLLVGFGLRRSSFDVITEDADDK